MPRVEPPKKYKPGAPKIGTRGRTARCQLTPLTAQKIYDTLLEGGNQKDACVLAGISTVTFDNWMEKGRASLNPPPHLQKYRDFALKVEECVHKDKLHAIREMRRSGRDAWQQWLANLKVRFPDEYGDRQRVQIDLEASQGRILDVVEDVCGKEAAVRVLERLVEESRGGKARETEDELEEVDR